MDTRRVCCCGVIEGPCGFIGQTVLCAGDTPVGDTVFIGARSIRYSGRYSFRQELLGAGVTDDYVITEQGVVGYAYQFGEPPTDAQIIADEGLAGYDTVTISAPFTLGASAWGRRFVAVTRSDPQNIGRQVINFPSDSTTWSTASIGFSCSGSPGWTYSISGNASNRTETATYRQQTPFDPRVSVDESYRLTVSLNRSTATLPGYWNGPSDFSPCGLVGSSFQSNPNPSIAPDPSVAANASMIEDAMGQDPQRRCRSCGQ
jgi:hypothetical protein